MSTYLNTGISSLKGAYENPYLQVAYSGAMALTSSLDHSDNRIIRKISSIAFSVLSYSSFVGLFASFYIFGSKFNSMSDILNDWALQFSMLPPIMLILGAAVAAERLSQCFSADKVEHIRQHLNHPEQIQISTGLPDSERLYQSLLIARIVSNVFWMCVSGFSYLALANIGFQVINLIERSKVIWLQVEVTVQTGPEQTAPRGEYIGNTFRGSYFLRLVQPVVVEAPSEGEEATPCVVCYEDGARIKDEIEPEVERFSFFCGDPRHALHASCGVSWIYRQFQDNLHSIYMNHPAHQMTAHYGDRRLEYLSVDIKESYLYPTCPSCRDIPTGADLTVTLGRYTLRFAS